MCRSVFIALIFIIATGPFALAGEMTFHTIFHVDKDQTYNCTFGLREDATPGYDNLDVPAPPAAPDEDLDGYLAMIDPPVFLPNRWYKDYRPVSNLTLDRIEFFPFNLFSSHVGEAGSISIATGAFNSLPYEMWIIGPDGLYEQVDVPSTVHFTITSPQMAFTWELRLDDDIPTESSSWADVKSLYR